MNTLTTINKLSICFQKDRLHCDCLIVAMHDVAQAREMPLQSIVIALLSAKMICLVCLTE